MLRRIKTYFRKLLFDRRYPSFYLVNAVGWILFIMADNTLVTIGMKGRVTLITYVSNILQWSTGYLVTMLMRIVYKRYYEKESTIWKTLILISVTSIIAAIFFFSIAHVVYSLFFFPDSWKVFIESFTFNNITFRMTQVIPMLTAWSMLYFGIKFWFDISAQKEKAQKADLLAQSAQLQMLRYQVNPHFLFNSFSSLRALIRKNSKAAADMVGKLSEFYRYSLITKSNSEVPLKNEIEAIQYYAEIEKIRFDEKVEFNFEIDPESEEYLIPSFIIHPIFENAVKYGILTTKLPLKIFLKTSLEKQTLKIEIINSGKWYKSPNNAEKRGTGTGLNNIRNRLNLLYPEKYNLDVFEKDGFVFATLEITRGKNEKV